MSSAQDRVLEALYASRAFERPRDLAHTAHLNRTTAHSALVALEDRGFVMRHPHVRGLWGITVEGYAWLSGL